MVSASIEDGQSRVFNQMRRLRPGGLVLQFGQPSMATMGADGEGLAPGTTAYAT